MFNRGKDYASRVVSPGIKNKFNLGKKYIKESLPGAESGKRCDPDDVTPCKNAFSEICDHKHGKGYICQKDEKSLWNQTMKQGAILANKATNRLNVATDKIDNFIIVVCCKYLLRESTNILTSGPSGIV